MNYGVDAFRVLLHLCLQIDAAFIAAYQMNYGVDAGSQEDKTAQETPADASAQSYQDYYNYGQVNPSLSSSFVPFAYCMQETDQFNPLYAGNKFWQY